MALKLRSDLDWLNGHAAWDDKEQGWKCKETGAFIECYTVRRSLHDGIFKLSGSGQVVEVDHLFCPGCNPGYQPPTHGTPINSEQLTDVG